MKSALTHTINRARRRGAMAAVLEAAGRGFAMAAAVAISVLIVSRLLGHDLPILIYPAIVLAGILVGAIRATVNLPEAFDVALHLDRTMRLRDRLASAFAVANAPHATPALKARHPNIGNRFDPEFAALVREEGEQLASKIDVRSLAPVRIGPAWSVGAAVSVLLFLGVLYMPVMAWGDGGAADEPAAVAERERADEERERLRAEVQSIMEDLREDEELAQMPGAREELDALERLAEQLAQGGSPDEVRRAREETAARLNELADQLNEQARRDAEAAQRLAERFAGLEAPERPMSAQEFDDALRRGDFGAAAEAMQDHLDRVQEMSEEERRELAQHLRETAENVDRIAAEDDAELAERMAQLEQMLRDYGLDEDLMRDAVEGDEQAQREAMQRLEEMLADEESAERLQRELERMREEQELQEQLKRDLEQMNEAMREAADELDPAPPEGERPESEPDRVDPDDPEARDPADDVEREGEREDAEREPGGEPQREQQQERDDPTGEQQREQAREDPEQPGQEVTESPEGEPDVEEAVREAVEEGEGPEEEGIAREQEIEEPGEGEPGADPGTDPEAQEQQRRSPSDSMREMEQRRQQAERRQQAADRARQRARELADSPERDVQRELQRQLARDPSGEAGRESADHAPGEMERPRDAEVEDLDARTEDDDPGRVIAEWFDDEELAADPEVRRTQIEQRVRQARRIAERAVEDAAVPARHRDFVRRYFDRLGDANETADER